MTTEPASEYLGTFRPLGVGASITITPRVQGYFPVLDDVRHRLTCPYPACLRCLRARVAVRRWRAAHEDDYDDD